MSLTNQEIAEIALELTQLRYSGLPEGSEVTTCKDEDIVESYKKFFNMLNDLHIPKKDTVTENS